jgi:hypothetical protein
LLHPVREERARKTLDKEAIKLVRFWFNRTHEKLISLRNRSLGSSSGAGGLAAGLCASQYHLSASKCSHCLGFSADKRTAL